MAKPKQEKKKATRYMTPLAPCLFAHIHEIDYGTDDYPNPDGSYSITLRLSEDEAAALFEKLEGEIEQATQEAEEKYSELSVGARKKLDAKGGMTFDLPRKAEYDRETEEETGYVLVRFKTKATYKNKDGDVVKRKVPLFDSVNKGFKLTHEIGNGSLVKVAFTCNPYFVEGTGTGGISLYLDALQIVDLKSFGERSAEDYGFSQEEGGFESAAQAGFSDGSDYGVNNDTPADDEPF